MATIGDDANGRKRILFVAGDGSRKTIRIGKATTRQAETFKLRVEKIIGANITGDALDDETARWLSGLDDKIHARLAAVGLVKSRTGGRAMIGAFIDTYLAGRPDLKPMTVWNFKQVRRRLVDCFGENRDLRSIGTAEAEEFRLFMVQKGLGENTMRRDIGRSRQLFKAAIRRGLVRGTNPFEGMASTVRSDKSRQFFVTREMAAKVIDACPDAQWRLLFALCRYGGLRCPSETLALKWADIDWASNRIRVPSPKTEHLEGKDCRMIPLFPEIRPFLLEAFEQAQEGTEYVITRYRNPSANLRTQFDRIIGRAGLTPWPKLFHNLRATRQTELAEKYPLHVVCNWIGNTTAIAQEHYLTVNDAHFAQAVQGGVSSDEKAAQNAAQYPPESSRIDQYADAPEMQNRPDLPSDSALYETVHFPNYPQGESNLLLNRLKIRGFLKRAAQIPAQYTSVMARQRKLQL